MVVSGENERTRCGVYFKPAYYPEKHEGQTGDGDHGDHGDGGDASG